jgi:hypothetical protein
VRNSAMDARDTLLLEHDHVTSAADAVRNHARA